VRSQVDWSFTFLMTFSGTGEKMMWLATDGKSAYGWASFTVSVILSLSATTPLRPVMDVSLASAASSHSAFPWTRSNR